jgi:hypothetical protein
MSLVPKTSKIVKEKSVNFEEDNVRVKANEKALEMSQEGHLKIMAIYNSKEDLALASKDLRDKKTQLPYSLCQTFNSRLNEDQDIAQERKQRNNINKCKTSKDERKKNHLSDSQETNVKIIKGNDLQSLEKNEVGFSVCNTASEFKDDDSIQFKENDHTTEEAWFYEKKEIFSSESKYEESEQAIDLGAENSFGMKI